MNMRNLNKHPQCTPELERKMWSEIDSAIAQIADQTEKSGTTSSQFSTNRQVVLEKIRQAKAVCGLDEFGNSPERAFDDKFRYYRNRVKSNGISDKEE